MSEKEMLRSSFTAEHMPGESLRSVPATERGG